MTYAEFIRRAALASWGVPDVPDALHFAMPGAAGKPAPPHWIKGAEDVMGYKIRRPKDTEQPVTIGDLRQQLRRWAGHRATSTY